MTPSSKLPRAVATAAGAAMLWAVLALAVLSISACSSAGVGSGPRDGSVEPADRVRVTRVFDGDTVEVRYPDGAEAKVRLIGIDSPEMDDERETVLFFAHMAKRFAFHHLYEKTVGLAYDWERTDDYGRTLAYVVLEDGVLFNERIIGEGFAYAFTRYPYRDDLRARFLAAQKDAREGGRGLWRQDPWPVVGPGQARAHLGRVATVSFVCKSVVEKGRYVYLQPADGEFEVFIQPPSPVPDSELRALAGRSISVTGFVEEFRGRIQVVLSLRSQLVSQKIRTGSRFPGRESMP